MILSMGIALGQKSRPTGLCIVQASGRDVDGDWETHYLVRSLERIDPATAFPEVANRVCEVLVNLKRKTSSRPSWIYVDATGLGPPIVSLLEAKLGWNRTIPVYFNYGDQRRVERDEKRRGDIVKLGKCYLVSRLQLLLQTNCLHLPRRHAEAQVLARDLMEYEIRPDERANERYGAFRVGSQDHLVTALGLALQDDVRTFRPRSDADDDYRPGPLSLAEELSGIWWPRAAYWH